MTVSERRLWDGLKRNGTGARFRRQVPVGPWIVDFACLKPKLAIEVDDTSHNWRDEGERTDYLESCGFVVLRFTNEEIARDVHAALSTIEAWIGHIRETGVPPE